MFVLVAIVVGLIIIKKISSCLVRAIIILLVVAVMAYIYLTFFK